MPVIEHYEKIGRVAPVDGSPAVEVVHAEVVVAVTKVLS
jgi:hypothetical protein